MYDVEFGFPYLFRREYADASLDYSGELFRIGVASECKSTGPHSVQIYLWSMQDPVRTLSVEMSQVDKYHLCGGVNRVL